MKDKSLVFFINFFRQSLFIQGLLLPLLIFYGMNDSHFFLLNGIFLGSLFLFEIPTGLFSDKYGSRRSIIISSVFYLLGALAVFLFQNIISFSIMNVFFGISLSFLSGSDDAILIHQKKQDNIIGTKIFFKRIGNVFATLIAGSILYFSPDNYIILISIQIPACFLAIICSFKINFKNGHHIDLDKKGLDFKSVLLTMNRNYEIKYLICSLIISSSTFFMFFNSFQPLLKLYNFPIYSYPIIFSAFQFLLALFCLKGNIFSKMGIKLTAIGTIPILGIIIIGDNKLWVLIALTFALAPRSSYFYYYTKLLNLVNKKQIASYGSVFNSISCLVLSAQSFLCSYLSKFLDIKEILIVLGLINILFFIIHYFYFKKKKI
jgi:MFS family permease